MARVTSPVVFMKKVERACGPEPPNPFPPPDLEARIKAIIAAARNLD